MQSRREGEVKAGGGRETETQRQPNKAPKNQGREKGKENQGPKHRQLWTNDPARGGARGPQGPEGRTRRLTGSPTCVWVGCWWLQGQATEFGYLGGAGWADVPSPATVGLAGPRGRGVGGGSRRQRRRVHLAVRSELVLPACLDNMGTGGESLRS